MKPKVRVPAVLIAALALLLSGAARQSAEQLFQSGLYREEVVGKLEEAIEIYEEIVKKYPENRPIAARALYHLGLCFEKLGISRAQEAFQKIVDDYAEQAEVFRLARARLSVLKRDENVGQGDRGVSVRKVGSLEVLGAPSPDGSLISYVDWDTGGLALYEVDSGKTSRITDGTGGFPERSIFSPDGKSIAYNRFRYEGSRFDLRVVAVDGADERILYDDENTAYVWPCAWTADSRQILTILTGKDRLSRIALISAWDGSARTIKEFKSGAPGKLSLSPDGRWIAYAYPRAAPNGAASEKCDLFLLSIDGRREVPLVTHPADDRLLGWSPDGKWILFSSDRSGKWDAWVQQVEDGKAGGNPRLVKRDFGDLRTEPMGFTQDGSFFYGFRATQYDVYVLSIDPATGGPSTGAQNAALCFEGSNGYPCWSPEGDRIAYTSFRKQDVEKPVALCIKSIGTGEVEEFFPQLKDFNTIDWFPDGNSILCRTFHGTHPSGLFQVSFARGESRPVLDLGDLQGLHGPILSHDGRKIFYDLDDFTGRTFRVMSYDLESGQEKEIIRSENQITRYDLSPDGNTLVFGEPDDGGPILKMVPSEGGEQRILLRLEDGGNIGSIAWFPDGRFIYFSQWEAGGSAYEPAACSLWRISAEGGAPRRYNVSNKGLENLRFRPDGRQLAFNSWRMEAEVWVMENFLPK